jgi:hypothetical protein
LFFRTGGRKRTPDPSTVKTPRRNNSLQSKLARSARHKAEWDAKTEEEREAIYQERVRRRELTDLRSRLYCPAGSGRGGSFLHAWPCGVLLRQCLEDNLHPVEITQRLRDYERSVLDQTGEPEPESDQFVVPVRAAFEPEDPEPCGPCGPGVQAASILRIAAPPPGPSNRIVIIEDESEPETLPAPPPDVIDATPEAEPASPAMQ